MGISLSQLSAIPHLDTPNLQGRIVNSLIFYDLGAWRTWVPIGDQLIEIAAWPAEAIYFGSLPASPNDYSSNFLDFVGQRVSYPEIQKPFRGVLDDLFNLSASLAKMQHLHATKEAIGSGASRMMTTEVEYLFSTCRSVFDLLQEIACLIWEKTQLFDCQIKTKPLRKTFSKMISFGGEIATEEELTRVYGLPKALSQYYLRNAEFFLTLRDFRDNIVHHGSQMQAIFSGEKEFLVQHSFKPFTGMEIWREDEKELNDLVPLFPALAVVVYKTLYACDDFCSAMAQAVVCPPPIAPKMKLYARGYFNEVLFAALEDAGKRIAS